MIGVFYSYHNYHKINGSLYYAFEYSTQLNCPLYIINATNNDINFIIEVFKDKYLDNVIEDSIIIPIRKTDIFKLNIKKALFLDIRSYNEVKYFVLCESHVFADSKHTNYRSKNKTLYYGSYDYQEYDVECILKLNTKIFKKLQQIDDKIFISTVRPEVLKKIDYHKDYLYKSNLAIIDNLFNHIRKIIYIHEQLDTNNRIIIEAYYYKIELEIIENTNIIDSVILRNNDCKNGLISKYQLDDNCVMIQNMQI